MITMKTSKVKFTTMTRMTLLMLSGNLATKASRNFAKPVSYKDITKAMQKAVQSTEGTKRQYCEVSRNETILKYFANVYHCMRAWSA